MVCIREKFLLLRQVARFTQITISYNSPYSPIYNLTYSSTCSTTNSSTYNPHVVAYNPTNNPTYCRACSPTCSITKRSTYSPVLIKIQPVATVCRYLFTAKSLYIFRVSQHPSSGVLKTVTAASGTGHNTGTATSLQRGLIGHYYDLYLRLRLQFLVLLMMGTVTPEICRVTLQ